MVGARLSSKDGKVIVILGLSTENMLRLKANKPMWLKPETHNFLPDNVEVIIVGGETEEQIQKQLEVELGIGPGGAA